MSDVKPFRCTNCDHCEPVCDECGVYVGRDIKKRIAADVDAAVMAAVDAEREAILLDIFSAIGPTPAPGTHHERRRHGMSEPSKHAFAEAARVIPRCPDCRDNGDEPPRIDPGCCVWCDRALDQVARAIDAGARRAALEEAAGLCAAVYDMGGLALECEQRIRALASATGTKGTTTDGK
jgi:ferredoxin